MQAQLLLLISGGTGLAPILQALAASVGLHGARGGYSNVVLVHSARTAADVTLMGNIGAILAATRVPVHVHFAITQGGALQVPFACTQSVRRVDANVLAQLWVGVCCKHICVINERFCCRNSEADSVYEGGRQYVQKNCVEKRCYVVRTVRQTVCMRSRRRVAMSLA